MRNEDELRLQAWVDGEIHTNEDTSLAEWIKSHPKAREVFDEIRSIKTLLKAGEKPVKVRETREFYWAQIDRRIDAVEIEKPYGVEEPASSWMIWCRQWLVPVGGLVAVLVLISMNGMQLGVLPEIPAGTSGAGSLIDRSDSPLMVPSVNVPSFVEQNGIKEGEVLVEDIDVLIQKIPTDGNLNLNPGLSERTIPSIENPDR